MIITLFLCIGTFFLLVEYIPDLIGHPPDSFIGEAVIVSISFVLFGGIIMIMRPFLEKKPDRYGSSGDGGGYGDGGGDGGDD